MLDVLEMYTVIIIDSGVLMEHRMFENPIIAEKYVMDYVNSDDEVVKRGGKWFVSYGSFLHWLNATCYDFAAHIIHNKLRVRP